MNVNDYVLPAPGSLVTPVVQSKREPAYLVIAARQNLFPSGWKQYELTLMGNNRLIRINFELSDFHHNWNVLHRP